MPLATVSVSVGTQAGATVAAVAAWLWIVEATGLRASLLLLGLFAARVVWRWAHDAEWERATGLIAAPDDDGGRRLDALDEVTAPAILIGTAAGFVLAAVFVRTLLRT